MTEKKHYTITIKTVGGGPRALTMKSARKYLRRSGKEQQLDDWIAEDSPQDITFEVELGMMLTIAHKLY